jgi:hypothetical protein
MLIVALALVVVAATAAVVIRDAHPRPAKPVPAASDATPEPDAQPLVLEMPQAIEPAGPASVFETDVDAPTQSMPAPLAFAGGGQAAALLPYAPIAVPVPEPEQVQPAAFVPAGTPYLQPDPDHLIQTEVVIEDPDREHSAAVTKLLLGMAVSGTAMGLVIVGAGRGIGALIHLLLR